MYNLHIVQLVTYIKNNFQNLNKLIASLSYIVPLADNKIKSYWFNFTKHCIHFQIYNANTYDKEIKGQEPIISELFPFVILNSFVNL